GHRNLCRTVTIDSPRNYSEQIHGVLKMKTRAFIRRAVIGMGLATVVSVTSAAAQTSRPEDLNRQALQQRAIDAAIWGMTIVSVNAMRRAFFRDAKANYNDIVFWSKPSDWKNQTTAPNTSARYVYFNFNTKDGPVVVDIPPAVGAGLFGTLLDAWQV